MLPVGGSLFFGRVPLLVPSIPRRLQFPEVSTLSYTNDGGYLEAELYVTDSGPRLFALGSARRTPLPVRFTPKLALALAQFEGDVAKKALQRRVFANVSRHPIGGLIARKIQTMPELPWRRPLYWHLQIAKFAGLVIVSVAWWLLAGFEVLAVVAAGR